MPIVDPRTGRPISYRDLLVNALRENRAEFEQAIQDCPVLISKFNAVQETLGLNVEVIILCFRQDRPRVQPAGVPITDPRRN